MIDFRKENLVYFDSIFTFQKYLEIKDDQVINEFLLRSGLWFQIITNLSPKDWVGTIDLLNPFDLGIIFI